jgi:hypothetical protein
MAHDSDYYGRRAAEARVAACRRDDGEGPEIAGQLALAYAALARRRKLAQPPLVAAPETGLLLTE